MPNQISGFRKRPDDNHSHDGTQTTRIQPSQDLVKEYDGLRRFPVFVGGIADKGKIVRFRCPRPLAIHTAPGAKGNSKPEIEKAYAIA